MGQGKGARVLGGAGHVRLRVCLGYLTPSQEYFGSDWSGGLWSGGEWGGGGGRREIRYNRVG